MTPGTDVCLECGNSTAFGSGRFVNRIPAAEGNRHGWLCWDCYALPCDHCGALCDDGFADDGTVTCDDCQPVPGQ